MVGVGLSQVGEFAFLLLSHAKHLRLLPKRMYLLTLGTTALSLLVTPLLWRAALCVHDRHRRLASPPHGDGSSAETSAVQAEAPARPQSGPPPEGPLVAHDDAAARSSAALHGRKKE